MNKINILSIALMLAIVTTTAQTYHEDDKEGLRIFLQQPSAEIGKINAEQLGLHISDTLNWQTDETWVTKIEGIEWDNMTSPKRLIEIYKVSGDLAYGWTGRMLAGTLNAEKWTELTMLNCSNNQLTVLNVSANTVLKSLYCDNNLLTQLGLSANTELIDLFCCNNQLTELDLWANTKLITLVCVHNLLTKLDVSTNTVLKNLQCYDNLLTDLDVSTNIVLRELHCNDNQLKTLNVNGAVALTWVICYNNRLPLSELFVVSKRVTEQNSDKLGTQNLLPQMVMINSEIDYTNQNIFDSTYTQYTITQNDNPVSNEDYNVTFDGKISFKRSGNYTVTMTNEAVVSRADSPAKVIVEVEVIDENTITEMVQDAANITIYPNPTTNQLNVECEQWRDLRFEIFSITGQKIMQGKLQETTTVNIESLENGMYYLKIAEQAVKFVKE